jgi:hypothetical protein
MLAMIPKAPRGIRQPTSSFTTIASKLAPTVLRSFTPLSHRPGTCRSELAREELKGAAGSQAAHVIVHDHREQACSYSVEVVHATFASARDL